MTNRKKIRLTLKGLVAANLLCWWANVCLHQWVLASIAMSFCLLALAAHFVAEIYL